MRHPKEQYIFAVDKTKNKSLKKLIKSISKCISTGETHFTFKENKNFNPIDFRYNELSVNLKVKPSKVFEDEKFDEEEEEDFEKRKFKWHCELGISQNIKMLRKEFTDSHNLVPVKLFITGPPGSGKTDLAKTLSSIYNVPCINILDIIKYGKSLKSDLGREVMEAIDAERQKTLDELNELEQKKKEPKEIDPSTIKEFLPLNLVFKVLKTMLFENVYINRGYILDGFPKSYSEAMSCFKEIDEEKDENDPLRERILNEILPNGIVLLNVSNNSVLCERYMKKKEEELIGTHYNEKDMMRRLKKYRLNNESEFGDYSVGDFFIQQGVKILRISGEKSKEFLKSQTKIFIERNGPINNYINEEIQNDKIENKNKLVNLSSKEAEVSNKKEIYEFYEKLQKQERFNYNKKKIDELNLKEKENLEKNSRELRSYLTENVIPILSKGILEICKKCPDDPVDELAKFLMENSNQVAFSEPSKYKPD